MCTATSRAAALKKRLSRQVSAESSLCHFIPKLSRRGCVRERGGGGAAAGCVVRRSLAAAGVATKRLSVPLSCGERRARLLLSRFRLITWTRISKSGSTRVSPSCPTSLSTPACPQRRRRRVTRCFRFISGEARRGRWRRATNLGAQRERVRKE